MSGLVCLHQVVGLFTYDWLGLCLHQVVGLFTYDWLGHCLHQVVGLFTYDWLGLSPSGDRLAYVRLALS